jgi:hypothetical protein
LEVSIGTTVDQFLIGDSIEEETSYLFEIGEGWVVVEFERLL